MPGRAEPAQAGDAAEEGDLPEGERFLRVFVAVELEDSVLDRVEALVGELRHELADIRWARRASFHLTLKFLGEVDEALIPALQGRLQQAAAASGAFEIAVEGLGTFGDRKRPRVVWAGIHERTGALDALQAGVEGAADSEGIEAEARPFRPHLTLARLKRSHPGLGRALAPRSSISLGSSRVSGFTLMQSRLDPGGTLYTPLHRFRFREPAGGGAA